METTDISKNVSFTGHRSGRISQPMLTLFTGMVTEIKRLYALGYRNFLSGMAEGSDLIFAKAVLTVRNELTDIRLVAAIPCHPVPGAVRTLFRHEQEALHQPVGRSGQDGCPFRKLSQGLFPPAQRLSGETCGNHARLLGRTTLWRHILYGKESYRSR